MLTEACQASVKTEQGRFGSAGVAGDRFGVEAAVGRIEVFRTTGLAHCERRHRCFGAIKRNTFDNAETRSAMRAVGERVAKTALGRVFNFRDTGVADRGVRRDLRVSITANTLSNPELMRQVPSKWLRFDTVDLPERWWLTRHALDKGSDRSLIATDAYENPVGVIQDFAR